MALKMEIGRTLIKIRDKKIDWYRAQNYIGDHPNNPFDKKTTRE